MSPLHPTTATLSRYMDDELSAWRRSRVRAHVERCARCSALLADWRDAAERIRAEAIPQASPDLLERILARRAAGERVLAPAAPVPPQPRVAVRAGLAAAAVVLVALAATLFVGSADLHAGASELRFSTTQPRVGERVTVEYRSGSLLSGQERLVLRARFRTPADESYNAHMRTHSATELHRGEDGVFRGAVRLPDSVVYAIFAVEDPAATAVDSNHQRGWELLVHGSDARPLLAALIQRMHDLMGRNWEEGHATARLAARLYPDSVAAFTWLQAFDGWVLGSASRDSLAVLQRARLEALHGSLLARSDPSPDEVAWMFWSTAPDAAPGGDPELHAYWKARVRRDHPAHPLVVQDRVVFELLPAYGADPAALLDQVDRQWAEIGPVHSQQVHAGLRAARELGDPDAVLRWVDRALELGPGSGYGEEYLARALVALPDLRPEGMLRLRSLIRRVERFPDDERGLFLTRQEYRDRATGTLRRLYGVLGVALVESGQLAAGLDTLALAVNGGWDPELFGRVAEARFSAGDTLGALDLWARVAVDPTTAADYAADIRGRAGARFDSAAWRGMTEQARERMRREVLAGGTSRPLRGGIRLLDADHTVRPLAAGSEGLVTVVVFWSRHCGPALQALPAILELSDRLEKRGAHLVMITSEAPSEELRSFLADHAPGIPVLHDTRGEAASVFSNWGTPTYYVLDRSGRLRFANSSLPALERQVVVLTED